MGFLKSALKSSKELLGTIGGNLKNIVTSTGKAVAFAPATLYNQIAKEKTNLGAVPTKGMSKDDRDKVEKQNTGKALESAGVLATTFFGGGLGRAAKYGLGASAGAAIGGGSALQEGGDFKKGAAAGTALGLAGVGIMDAFSGIFKAVSKTPKAQGAARKAYTREFTAYSKAEKARLEKAIENDIKRQGERLSGTSDEMIDSFSNTITEKMRKYGFSGTDKQIGKQAGFTLSKDKPLFDNTIKQYENIKVPTEMLKERVLNSIKGNRRVISPAQLKNFDKYFNSVAKRGSYSPQQLNNIKIASTKALKPSEFVKIIADDDLAFKSDVYNAIAGESRRMINEVTEDNTIRLLNDRMSTALETIEIIKNKDYLRAINKPLKDRISYHGVVDLLLYVPRTIGQSQRLGTSVAQKITNLGNPEAMATRAQLPSFSGATPVKSFANQFITPAIFKGGLFSSLIKEGQSRVGAEESKSNISPADYGNLLNTKDPENTLRKFDFNPADYGGVMVK